MQSLQLLQNRRTFDEVVRQAELLERRDRVAEEATGGLVETHELLKASVRRTQRLPLGHSQQQRHHMSAQALEAPHERVERRERPLEPSCELHVLLLARQLESPQVLADRADLNAEMQRALTVRVPDEAHRVGLL